METIERPENNKKQLLNKNSSDIFDALNVLEF
jgi:hypothetical protein